MDNNYGVITEQGFPFEDQNSGFKSVNEEDQKILNKSFNKDKNEKDENKNN